MCLCVCVFEAVCVSRCMCMCCLDCSTKAQVLALKFFQQDACEDDHWRSRGTVERVSETQDAYTCAAAVAMLVICTGDSSIQWPSDAGQAFVSRCSTED